MMLDFVAFAGRLAGSGRAVASIASVRGNQGRQQRIVETCSNIGSQAAGSCTKHLAISGGLSAGGQSANLDDQNRRNEVRRWYRRRGATLVCFGEGMASSNACGSRCNFVVSIWRNTASACAGTNRR